MMSFGEAVKSYPECKTFSEAMKRYEERACKNMLIDKICALKYELSELNENKYLIREFEMMYSNLQNVQEIINKGRVSPKK